MLLVVSVGGDDFVSRDFWCYAFWYYAILLHLFDEARRAFSGGAYAFDVLDFGWWLESDALCGRVVDFVDVCEFVVESECCAFLESVVNCFGDDCVAVCVYAYVVVFGESVVGSAAGVGDDECGVGCCWVVES